MMTAGEGTLSRRMKDLEGNLYAKTGTIFGVSSLTGYLTSKMGKEYAFSIIIKFWRTSFCGKGFRRRFSLWNLLF